MDETDEDRYHGVDVIDAPLPASARNLGYNLVKPDVQVFSKYDATGATCDDEDCNSDGDTVITLSYEQIH